MFSLFIIKFQLTIPRSPLRLQDRRGLLGIMDCFDYAKKEWIAPL